MRTRLLLSWMSKLPTMIMMSLNTQEDLYLIYLFMKIIWLINKGCL